MERGRALGAEEPQPQRLILVVDDEAAIRTLMKDALELLGYQVITAADAEGALHAMAGHKIGLALLDLKMPGVTGVELCQVIRDRYPVTVLYAMTGYVSMFEVVRCREAGFDDYFTKPLDLPSLAKAISDGFERLDRWRSQPGAQAAGR